MRDASACPNCGAEVPVKAKACPECGSDEKTGWSEERHYDGTGIEDQAEFDYDEWHHRETGAPRPGIGWGWWAVAVVALAVFIWLIVFRGE